MLEIQKDVPQPAAKRQSKYPFADMNVGDSFKAPKHLRQSITNCAKSWVKRNNPSARFLVRSSSEDEGAVRVWRIA